MVTELADGVYVETGYETGNVALVASGHSALLIDTPLLPADARAWRAHWQQFGVDELYGIVNTDAHPEHFLGNAYYMPTRVIGHEATLRQAAKYRATLLEQLGTNLRDVAPEVAEQLAHLELCLPEIGVEDRLTVHLGDRLVEVLYINGHTPGSLGVYLPQERILFAGDNVVNNEHPDMAQANSQAWITSLARIQTMDVDCIVPGSGEPCDKQEVERLATYITELRARVSELFRGGASRRETVEKAGLADYYPVPEEQAARIRRRRRESIERIYAEVRTAERRR